MIELKCLLGPQSYYALYSKLKLHNLSRFRILTFITDRFGELVFLLMHFTTALHPFLQLMPSVLGLASTLALASE